MNAEIEKLRKEIEALKRTLQPIGSIQCFATLNVPDCWLPCDGRELMARMYPDLYQKIGNVFGGVPDRTFCLPDLQGRFIRGWDRDWNRDKKREFGSSQEDAFQGHGHKVNVSKRIQTDSSGFHTHKVYYDSTKVVTSVGGLGNTESSTNIWQVAYGEGCGPSRGKGTDFDGSHSHWAKIEEDTIQIQEPVSSKYGLISENKVAIETRPKNLALLYCIKVK